MLRVCPHILVAHPIYEAHPQSKFPWGRVQKQNTIAWKYLLQQIQQVFATGIETFVIPWNQLLYTVL
jgi:hypothetical protein